MTSEGFLESLELGEIKDDFFKIIKQFTNILELIPLIDVLILNILNCEI